MKVVQSEVNLGFAEGNNVGVRSAKGHYIVFLNPDTEAGTNWLKELVNVMESDSTVGSAQSKLLGMDQRNLFDGAGDFMDFYGNAWSRGRWKEDHGQYDSMEEIFSARGAAMIVRRSTLNRVGLFDSRFFSLLEDVDLGWRIRLAGYKNVFVPNSIVYHKSGYAIKSAPQKNFHASKNRIAMMIKNYRFKNLVKYVSARVVTDIGTAIRLLYLRKNGGAIAIIRAILWNLVKFQHVWKKHLKVQHVLREVSDEHLMERIMKKPSFPFILVLLNLFPFGRRLLKRYKLGDA